MNNTKKFLGAVAVAGVLAAGGSAFTAGNTLPDADVTKGYGSQTISGVAAESVTYNTDVPKENIVSVGLVLTGDTTAKTIQVAFNDAAPATCSGTGTFNATTDDSTYTCTVTQTVAGATKFALVAS